jgi:hypothetical protein
MSGYQTTHIKPGAKRQLKISLKSASKDLDEVVVIGYGSQRKMDLTGAADRNQICSCC